MGLTSEGTDPPADRARDRSTGDSTLDRDVHAIDPGGAVGKTERRSPGLGRDELMIEVLRVLEAAGDCGATKQDIVAAIRNTVGVSVQRALVDLRELHGAKIECVGKQRRWKLLEPFSMPLVAPDREDLVAVLVAQAILEPIADEELRHRLARLVEDLDERVRTREPNYQHATLPARSSVSATLTLGTPVDPAVLRTLLETCKRKVLRIEYDAPWKPLGDGRRSYEIEPLAVRVHDGAVYLRAWRRDLGEPRTFRVAHIEEVRVIDGAQPRHPVPRVAEVWGDEEPAFGIDRDRPGRAVVRLRGPVARWVARTVWHPQQQDAWVVEGEVLERAFAYRSCRELARRLASVLDGVEAIAPEELRGEVEALVGRGLGATSDRELRGVMYRVQPGAPDADRRQRAADRERR